MTTAKNATFYLDEELMSQAKKVVEDGLFKSLNALVESALKAKLETLHREKIRQEIIEASQDPMFIADIAEIEQDFKHVDFETV